MREEALRLVLAEAMEDPKVVFLTGDVGFKVLDTLREKLEGRFLNVGVAEANLISVAAGMSGSGLRPYLYSIAPFLTLRCLEQIRNDLVFSNSPVRLIGIGAGFTYGNQGPSHHALEDLHAFAGLPSLRVFHPATLVELLYSFSQARDHKGPVYFRLGKEAARPRETFEAVGDAYVVREGKDLNFVVSGVLLEEVLAASALLQRDGISARVISVPRLQPFPNEAFLERLLPCPTLSVIEAFHGNPLEYGVMASLLTKGLRGFLPMSVERGPFQVGDCEALRREAGLQAETIARAAKALLAAFS